MLVLRTIHGCSGMLLAIIFQTGFDSAAAKPPFPPNTGNHILSTILDSGNPNSTLSAGYTTMETAETRCVYSGGCTLEMTIMASVVNATCTREWAIVGLLDGNSVDGTPLQNPLPHDGNQQTARWQGRTAVTNGSHTVAFQLYVPCPVNAEQWSVNYVLTRPQ